MKPLYKVPLAYRDVAHGIDADDTLMLSSDTLVFLVPTAVGNVDADTIRVRKVPTKPGVFEVLYEPALFSKPLGETRVWFEARQSRLSRATHGQRVLLWLPPDFPRPVVGGRPGSTTLHVVTRRHQSMDRTRWNITYQCGASVKYDALEGEHFVLQKNVPATCPDCLEREWHVFNVLPHFIPQVLSAIEQKERKAEAEKQRKFLARPTRFDRVAGDILAPTMRYKAPVVESVEDEPEGRDAKLEARVRQSNIEKEKRETFKRERRWR